MLHSELRDSDLEISWEFELCTMLYIEYLVDKPTKLLAIIAKE